MKKIYLVLGAAAIFASAGASSHEGRINLKDMVKIEKSKKSSVEVQSTSDQEVVPLKSKAIQKSSVSRKSLVLYEDFDKVPEGNTETIGHMGERYTDYIASRYVAPGRYIDNDYTPESGTWEGDFVFAGKNGTVILQCYNPYMGAQLNTPLGDYSGDLTVTVRARWSKPFIGADNELGYSTFSGSDLSCDIRRYGYDHNDYDMFAETDIPGGYAIMSSGQLYPTDGWQEITYTFRNMSANSDGYLNFSTSGAIEIDWIKVEDNNTYLACPVIKDATNFTKDGFTINWEEVRRSPNYYIDLWKTVYTADKGIDESCDFEGGELPEWISAGQIEFVDGEGENGSKAVLITADGENNGVATADLGMKLDSFTSSIKFKNDNEEDYIILMYDVLDENGWQPFGYLECNGWWTMPDYYYQVQLSGTIFEGLYSAVRVYAQGTTDDSMIFIDNMAIKSKRPYVLERVKGDYGMIIDSQDDDASYNYYTHTSNSDPQNTTEHCTSYTFVGLDPNTEYWYRVRSHNVNEFSVGEKHHAFGVVAPELQPASNVNASSYTANWIDAPKAQKYVVTNYTGIVAEEDQDDYTLMLESFGNCSGGSDFDLMEPIEAKEGESLDAYTDLRGWTGSNVCMGQNMLGGLDYTGCYLITPPIMCNPQRGNFYIYIDAQGYEGDYLHLTCLKSGLTGDIPFDETGSISGYIEVPSVEGEQIRFISYNRLGFGLCAFEALQSVKKGDVIRNFHSSVEVPAGQQAYTFSNLESGLYAYGVVSSFTLEEKTVMSQSEEFVTVDTTSGDSKVTSDVEAVENASEEISRYGIDGVRVGKDYKGVVIVKMADGNISKKIMH